MKSGIPGRAISALRSDTARSGPFTFQLGLALPELETLLLRVGDAHERFRSSPLSQVASRLEKEVVVSSIFGTNSIEGGTLSEHETQLALELDPAKVRDIEQRRAINLKAAYDLSRDAAAGKDWCPDVDFIRRILAAITDRLPHAHNRPGMLRDNAKDIVTHVGDATHGGRYKPPQHGKDIRLLLDALVQWHELTATPDAKATPSNVLHSVAATEPNWQQCLADAIARRDELQTLAEQERRKGAAYLRPIMLIQAEKRRQGVDTLDVDRVRQELIDNHRIPAGEIIVATGDERGLEKIEAEYRGGIADEACPVKFVITQQALAEGWDCPSAYILVSMAALHSATSVEQLLGRVLRQPEARHRDSRALNQSYAFVVSRDFASTASALRDRLVEGAGFDRRDANEFVSAAKPEQRPLDIDGIAKHAVIHPVKVELPEKPDMAGVPRGVRAKVKWDGKAKTLTISQPLSADEALLLQQGVASDAARVAIAQAAETSRTQAVEFFQTPAEQGLPLFVPQLALRIAAVRQAYQQTLFGDGHEARVAVDDTYRFEFPPDVYAYAPSRDYDGRFGSFAFRKHYYSRIGDFDSREEFECAVWLDMQAQRGRIDFWVRNLVRKESCSFFLQKADGRFYPDFICRLPNAVMLAVEYKGADRWSAAEDDRLIGGMWEDCSGGRCRFVMGKDNIWSAIF